MRKKGKEDYETKPGSKEDERERRGEEIMKRRRNDGTREKKLFERRGDKGKGVMNDENKE